MPNEVIKRMSEWADLVYKEHGGAYEGFEKQKQLEEAYKYYKKDLPSELTEGGAKAPQGLNEAEKGLYRQRILGVYEKNKADISMYPQGKKEEELTKEVSEYGQSFAYFMVDRKNIEANKYDGGSDARLTLTFDFKKAANAYEVLADVLEEIKMDPILSKAVGKLKVMGPKNQGLRTDSAVLYMNTTDKMVLSRITSRLTKAFGKKGIGLYDHAPFGMKTLARGISVSHRGLFSSSNGMDRANIIREAVMEKIKNPDLKMENLVSKVYKERGYDPDSPEQLDKVNYLENYDKNERSVNSKRRAILKYADMESDAERDLAKQDRQFGFYTQAYEALTKKDPESDQESRIKQALIDGAIRSFTKRFGSDEDLEKALEQHIVNAHESVFLDVLLSDLSGEITKLSQSLDELVKEEDADKEKDDVDLERAQERTRKVKQLQKRIQTLEGDKRALSRTRVKANAKSGDLKEFVKEIKERRNALEREQERIVREQQEKMKDEQDKQAQKGLKADDQNPIDDAALMSGDGIELEVADKKQRIESVDKPVKMSDNEPDKGKKSKWSMFRFRRKK